MVSNTTILGIASRQGGVIRRDQAIAAGFTEDQVDWRVSSGEWERVTKGGYRIVLIPGRLNLLRAAAAILPNATVSHFSAAALHGLTGVAKDAVSVTVPSKTTHTFPGVRVFRNDDIADWQRSEMSGLRVTTLVRTVLDLAGVLSRKHIKFIVDDLLTSGRCGFDDMHLVLESTARRGKPGISSMRAALEDRSVLNGTETPLEQLGNALLVKAGLTAFEREYPIPWMSLRRFDVAFPTERLAIEWDSREWHTLKQSFQHDRERDRLALENGWRVLRFTWADVVDHPDSVIETTRAVLQMTQPA